jgi:nanoRNase/pAp phosphatase (c-di-AMP/oligoRNAs hydrolase)
VCETGPDLAFASSAEAVGALLGVVHGARNALITTHNDPDPDSMASALALAYLLQQRLNLVATLAYGGIIGRAENKAMVRLVPLEMRPLDELDPGEYDVTALVDAQPGAGNVGLPHNVTPTIVIDHHSTVRSEMTGVPFADIRGECGATSTILTLYLNAADLVPDRPTATALFYGIKSDTMGLARAAGNADVEAYLYLLPLADVKIVAQIEQAQVPLTYFRAFERALEHTLIYDDVVISDLGVMEWPDLAAEMADFLLRWEGAHWIICMGVFGQAMVVSVRTNDLDGDAGLVVEDVVNGLGSGGGHGLMAGGRMPLKGRSASQMVRKLRLRFLERLGRKEGAGDRLI